MYDEMFDVLLPMLQRLEPVAQEPRFHPEGNALYHSLQVFAHARMRTDSPVLIATALLHDVGKSEPNGDHALAGAAMLDGIANPEVCWLVLHHLDLLRSPRETRQQLYGDPRLRQLEQLRVWDLAGRDPYAHVPDLERALGTLLEPGVAEGWLAAEAVVEDAY